MEKLLNGILDLAFPFSHPLSPPQGGMNLDMASGHALARRQPERGRHPSNIPFALAIHKPAHHPSRTRNLKP